MAKFMQSLNPEVYSELESMAEERKITVQELVRAIIIPEWMRVQGARRSLARGRAEAVVPHEAK